LQLGLALVCKVLADVVRNQETVGSLFLLFANPDQLVIINIQCLYQTLNCLPLYIAHEFVLQTYCAYFHTFMVVYQYGYLDDSTILLVHTQICNVAFNLHNTGKL